MTREIELPAGTVRVHERGDGPPLVFVHGVFVDSTLWRGVAAELERDHHCVLPDLPLGAHREPMKPGADVTPPGVARLIGELLEALDLRDVTLVANDTGGALTQIFLASGQTERVGRVVLTNCDSFENFLPPLFRPLQWLARVPGAVNAAIQPLRLAPLRRHLAFGLLSQGRIPDDVTGAWLEPLLHSRGVRRDTARFLAAIDKRQTLEAAKRLGSFAGPVLIAWGPEDRIFPFKHAERLARLFPDARVEQVAGSGAFVPEDQPERLAELIREFVPARAVASRGTAAA
jgi:pimeloyl-ACP methyl ester carboxylesterase